MSPNALTFTKTIFLRISLEIPIPQFSTNYTSTNYNQTDY